MPINTVTSKKAYFLSFPFTIPSCTHPHPQYTPAPSCTPVITTTGIATLTTQGGPEPWPAGFPSAELTQLPQCNEGSLRPTCAVFLSKQKATFLQKYLAPSKASKLVQTERDDYETEDTSFSFSLGSG